MKTHPQIVSLTMDEELEESDRVRELKKATLRSLESQSNLKPLVLSKLLEAMLSERGHNTLNTCEIMSSSALLL